MHYCPPQSNFRGGRVPRGIYATGTGHSLLDIYKIYNNKFTYRYGLSIPYEHPVVTWHHIVLVYIIACDFVVSLLLFIFTLLQ